MNGKLRIMPALSSIVFWIAFTTLSVPTILMFILFGIGTGLLIGKATPLSRLTWSHPALRWTVMLLGAALSVMGSVAAAHYFYQSWLPSAMLKGIVTRLIPDYETGLLGISSILGLGMLPFLFDVICRGLYHIWGMISGIHFASLWQYTKQTATLKGTLKSTALVIICLLLCAAIGIGLLTAVFCIPVDSIEKNVAKSALTLQEEGTYTNLSSWFHSRLDNWTDSIILMEAERGAEPTALKAAVDAIHGSTEGAVTPTEALIAHHLEGQPYTTLAEYSRYWHGYLVLLKPLLCLMDYNGIRILNGSVQLLLIALICLLLYKKGYQDAVIPFLLIYLMLMPLALACCIQFSNCFYVIALGVIGMLLIRREKRNRYAGFLFFAMGIAVSYLDYFSYPMATFGVPMLMLLWLEKDRTLEEKLVHTVKCGIFWCIGFGGMWASKWVISYLVSDYSFAQILSIVGERTSLSESAQTAGLFRVEMMNYMTFLTTPVTLLVLGFIGVRFFRFRSAKVNTTDVYRRIFPYLLVACAPILWYAFASGHSSIHYWFTNKSCAITVLGILLAVAGATSVKTSE